MRRATLLVFVALFAMPAMAKDPVRLKAQVVWSQDDRVYVALQDTVTVDTGTILSFKDKRKTVATGEVLTHFEGRFLVAKLVSGSLRKVKRPEKLLIEAQALDLRFPSKLRVGFPSSSRLNQLFACDGLQIDSTAAGAAAKRISEHVYELVWPRADVASWPDTLHVRLFDDAADQEIALERGELDMAVFWPGEASAHIREEMQWSGQPAGIRKRGFVGALFMARHPSVDSLAAAIVTRRVTHSLNDELFRGDLAPCGTAEVDTFRSTSLPPMRFEADAALPREDDIQKVLDREWKMNTLAKASDWVRIAYVDQSPDSLTVAIDVPGAAKSVSASDVICLYRIRCPVLCRPEMRSFVEAMGPDRIVNLISCRRPGTP